MIIDDHVHIWIVHGVAPAVDFGQGGTGVIFLRFVRERLRTVILWTDRLQIVIFWTRVLDAVLAPIALDDETGVLTERLPQLHRLA